MSIPRNFTIYLDAEDFTEALEEAGLSVEYVQEYRRQNETTLEETVQRAVIATVIDTVKPEGA